MGSSGINALITRLKVGFGVSQKKKLLQKPEPHRKAKSARLSTNKLSLYRSHVRDVLGPILSYLPLHAERELRDWTVKRTLLSIFADLSLYGNEAELSAQDLKDLGSFAEFAYYLSSNPSLQVGPRERQAIFKAVLDSLLSEWLHSWNLDGENGPPV